ncbi:hypothetical protein V8D89_008485 [Ganoderma adspersum]
MRTLRSGKNIASPEAQTPQGIPGEFSNSVSHVESLVGSLSPLSEPSTVTGQSGSTQAASEGSPRLYSQVAASRPPSAEPVVRVESPSVLPSTRDNSLVPGSTTNTSIAPRTTVSRVNSPEMSAEYSTPATQPVEEGWQEVRRRHRGRSMEAARDTPPHMVRPPGRDDDTGYESLGEGTSNLRTFRKGKAADPTNWGAAGIDPSELDPEVQRREFEVYAALRQAQDVPDAPNNDSWRARESTAVIPDSDSEEANPALGKGKSVVSSTRTWVKPEPSEPAEREFIAASDEAKMGHLATQIEQLEQELEELKLRSQTATPQTRTSQGLPAPPVPEVPPASDGPEMSSPQPPICYKHSQGAQLDTFLASQSGNQPRISPPAALLPVNQVPLTSYLGQALRGGTSGGCPPATQAFASLPDGSDPSLSSSLSSSASDNGSGDDTADRRQQHRLRKKRRQRRLRELENLRTTLPRVPVLKPREPKTFDGTPDAQTFHKFAREAEDYVEGYQLPPERQASAISYFLSGKAYECYANTVAPSPQSFSLRVRNRTFET